ncbi:hypothetical protein LP419_09900 [Massilia sp. H-1]|nr:hypothetical protein LP419_09900 [Massilia sp. H-1]
MMVNVSLRTLNVDQWMTIASAISNAKPEPVAPGAFGHGQPGPVRGAGRDGRARPSW